MQPLIRFLIRCRTPFVTAILASVLLATPVSAQEVIEYYALDALGSVRVIFDAQGNQVDRMDHGPFGENLRAAINFPVEQFAQMTRDAESGHDYAQARNYAVGTGRFNRVDPVYAGLFDPQAWNRYTYARNSPVVLIDPEGRQFRTGVNGCATPPENASQEVIQSTCTDSSDEEPLGAC